MTSQLYCIAVDCHDPAALSEFWAATLGRTARTDEDGDVVVEDPAGGPILLFLADPETKVVKNRLHFDLVPDDQDAEVARLEALGARRVDIGQRDVSWVVLADPEGNEFCVLRADAAD